MEGQPPPLAGATCLSADAHWTRLWLGGHASIQRSSFRDCHADENGGAVASMGHGFSVCEGAWPPACGLRIEDSTIEDCTATKGGCLADMTWTDKFDPTNTKLEMRLSNLTFSRCRARIDGAALSFTSEGAGGLTPITGLGGIRLESCTAPAEGFQPITVRAKADAHAGRITSS